MHNPPLIGITSARRIDPNGGWPYIETYAKNVAAIEKAGGLPVLISPELQESTLKAIFERLDGVLIPGGGDVNPSFYLTDPQAELVNVDDERDRLEIIFAQWAVENDVPILGICRGAQVLNVALGGTLVQDIPSQLPTTLQHDFPRHIPRRHRAHTVNVDENSYLARYLGQSKVNVNSLHHQAIQQPAPQVRVVAKAPDGVIEAIEIPERRFAIGVQWHPEDIADDAIQMRLFEAFVEATRNGHRS